MEAFFARFPDVAVKIFDNIDDKSLAISKTIGRPSSTYLNGEIFFWRRIIKKYTASGYEICTCPQRVIQAIRESSRFEKKGNISRDYHYQQIFNEEEKMDWRNVMKKANFENIKELGVVVNNFMMKYSNHKRYPKVS